MILKIQIYSILYSFLYGVIFNVLLEINYKFIYESKLLIKVISSLLFLLANTLLYFLILIKINNGIVHIYFLLSIILGYMSAYFIQKKLFKSNRKEN